MAVVEDGKILSFEEGLDREWGSALNRSSALRLINWQPTPEGGVRARRSWERSSNLGAPASPKVRAIGSMPLLAGYRVPIRRQRNKEGVRAGGATSQSAAWYERTLEGSLLVAVLSFTHDSSATSAINVTPPTGWQSVATVHGNDSPSSITTRMYIYPNAPERDGDERFTFSSAVQRAQLEIMEWRGVVAVDPVDVIKVNSGYSTKPDTDISAATDPANPTQLVIGVVAARTNDRTIKPSEFPVGWFPHQDSHDPPHSSVGENNHYLQQTVARLVTHTDGTHQFRAVYGATDDEDDAISRWTAMLVTFKAKLRSATDEDFYVVGVEQSPNTHELFKIDVDDLRTGMWQSIGQLNARSGSVTTQPLAMASGFNGMLITSRDVHKSPTSVHQGLFWWDGDVLVRVNRSPRAQALVFHSPHARFYAGGSADNPQRLYWCQTGDPSTWNLEEWWVDIGGDGEAILDVATVNEGMLVAKRHGLFLALGEGEIQTVIELPGGGGAKGRCICPIPGGAVIAGRESIWLYQGGAPRPIARKLDDWWVNPDRTHVYTAYVNGLVYISGADEQTCVVYDTEQGVWWTDKPPAHLFTVYSWDGQELLGGPVASGDGQMLYLRTDPGTARDRDVAAPQTFQLRTQAIMLGTPSRPITPKWLHVAYSKRNYEPGHPPVVVTPIYDGIPQTPRTITETHPVSGQPLASGGFRIRLDVGVKARTAAHKIQFDFTYDALANNGTVFDIEAVEFVYDMEERR